MKPKSTAILVILFLVLGSYVYFFETESGNKEGAVPAKIEKALDFNTQDVREIVIRDNRQGVLFQKTNGQWNLKQPEVLPVDPEKISDLLAAV